MASSLPGPVDCCTPCPGVSATITSSPVLVVDTTIELRGVATRSAETLVAKLGDLAAGDGDGGFYFWDPTSLLADDGLDVVKPSDIDNVEPGRWLLFSAIGGGSGGGGGGGGGGGASNLNIFDTIPNLLASDVTTIKSAQVYDANRGGFFQFIVGSLATVDNGTVFASLHASGIGGKWHRIYPPGELNVKWWGAVGNGSVDDTPAFNAVIASFPQGATIYIPKGTYKLTAPLVFASDKWNIRGDGQETTKLAFQSNIGPSPAIRMEVPGNYILHWALRDFAIELNSADGIGIRTVDAREFLIDNVKVNGFESGANSGVGLQMQGTVGRYSAFGGVQRMYIDGCKTGIVCSGSTTAVYIRNNTIEGIQNPVISGSIGVQVGPGSAGTGLDIDGNSIEGFSYGLVVIDGTYVTFTNNRCEEITLRMCWFQSGCTRCFAVGNKDFSVKGILDDTNAVSGEIYQWNNSNDIFAARRTYLHTDNIRRHGTAASTAREEFRFIGVVGAAPNWIKVGQITFDVNGQSAVVWGVISTRQAGGSASQWWDVKLSVLQTGGLGIPPIGKLSWKSNTKDPLNAVISAVTGSQSVVELFVRDTQNASPSLLYDLKSSGMDFVGVTGPITILPAGNSIPLDPIDVWGVGIPEGVVTAPLGSHYTRIDGGPPNLYIKETLALNTGWVGK